MSEFATYQRPHVSCFQGLQEFATTWAAVFGTPFQVPTVYSQNSNGMPAENHAF
jgi:hypothetical protein